MNRNHVAGVALTAILAGAAFAAADEPKVGDEPPKWRIAEARGVKRVTKVADYNGKWLVVVFWTYDSDPCTRTLLPRLMTFWDKDDKLQEKYAVLTFHVSKLKTFKQLDKELERLEKEVWEDRKLPFPILIDASGQTPQKWGATKLPTVYIIDPAGTIAYKQSNDGAGAEKFLAEKLGIKYEGEEGGDDAGQSTPAPDSEEKKGDGEKNKDKEDEPRDNPRRPKGGG